MMHY
jgi:hypothetical protein